MRADASGRPREKEGLVKTRSSSVRVHDVGKCNRKQPDQSKEILKGNLTYRWFNSSTKDETNEPVCR